MCQFRLSTLLEDSPFMTLHGKRSSVRELSELKMFALDLFQASIKLLVGLEWILLILEEKLGTFLSHWIDCVCQFVGYSACITIYFHSRMLGQRSWRQTTSVYFPNFQKAEIIIANHRYSFKKGILAKTKKYIHCRGLDMGKISIV